MDNLIKYYARKDIQKEIVNSSKNREVAVKFGDKGYGKRPDILQFENDVYEFVRKGATSFHISEERWTDPLRVQTGMSLKQLNELRSAWDLILDIDGANLEYSRLATYYIVEALKFYDIKNISLKFSGNKGLHIGIPFETFPKTLNKIEIKDFFPDGPRIIAGYLKSLVHEHLSSAILEKESVNEISEKLKKPKQSLIKNNMFDPFTIVDIDTILISSRHLFRSPYSYNEKSGLISIPIKINNLMSFDKNQAKIGNVETGLRFLDSTKIEKEESTELFDKSIYWNLKNFKKEETKTVKIKTYDVLSFLIPEEFFPPCIKILSSGVKSDGRKRALFILLNFLKSVGYNHEDMEQYVLNWNKRNYEPLKEGYIKAQLTWHKRQGKIILPPNCPERQDNIPLASQQNYYTDLQFCKPDDFCKLIKNPINYAIKKQRLFGKKNK